MVKYAGDFGIDRVFGVDEAINENEASSIQHFGVIHQLKVVLKSEDGTALQPDVNTSANGFGRGSAKIPAGATIKAAYLFVNSKATTAAATVDIGTYKADGTAIDADGLFDAAIVGTDTMKTAAGALVGTKVTEDSYIKAVKGGAEEAGAFAELDAVICIEYV